MKTRIEAYAEEHVPLVKAMNARLEQGGSRWRFYDSHVPEWLPVEPGSDPSVSRRYFVVRGDDGGVHGCYCFKEQTFRLKGQERVLATWQGPVSEGLVDKRFRKVGLQCLMDMRDRNPLLFVWGGSEQLRALLESLGWRRFGTPLFLKMVRPRQVLQQAPFLRTNPRVGRIIDLAAMTGAGGLAIQILQRATALRHRGGRARTVTPVEAFGDWSDQVWEVSKGAYDAIALRDQDSLARLMGRPGWPDARILRVETDGGVPGWAAIRVNRMTDDRRFGSLVVGSIIDALAPEGHESAVIHAATGVLEREGVALIAGNVMHRRWREAFAGAGFLAFANRRDLFLSPDLDELMGELGIDYLNGWHLMPIDGDGPFGL